MDGLGRVFVSLAIARLRFRVSKKIAPGLDQKSWVRVALTDVRNAAWIRAIPLLFPIGAGLV
jgi:hypothetical protein